MDVGLAEVVAEAIQKAWLAGRASRDGLRDALVDLLHEGVLIEVDGQKIPYTADVDKAVRALAEDDKIGGGQ